MRTDLTDITLVLDRSGSMAVVQDDTIGGVNTFLKDQAKSAGSALTSANVLRTRSAYMSHGNVAVASANLCYSKTQRDEQNDEINKTTSATK